MNTSLKKGLTIALSVAALATYAVTAPVLAEDAPPKAAQAAGLTAIPKDKDHDLKLYAADGTFTQGAEALGKMQSEAKVIMWLAGNQFFAMDDVIHAFQKKNPGVTVGLITLPPGLILKAIKSNGWTYGGKDYPGRPDIYGSVNIGHLKELKKAGLMDSYETYMHNELQIMVAKGNPKKIKGIDDLVRADVHTSNPNPVSEGIMQFYVRKVFEKHGIWDKISAGKICASCQTTPNNWFTAVHHRETPERIKDGRSDAGMVWKTEVLAAVRDGADVEGIVLPPEDSLRNEVGYVIGGLTDSPRKAMASKYLDFLRTQDAQDAYAKYGFVSADADELKLKPLE